MYADFYFYENTFLGKKIKEEDFNRFEQMAENELDMLCMYRIDDTALAIYDKRIGRATCAVAEILYDIEKASTEKPIQSISSGGESFTYANVKSLVEQAVENPTAKSVLMWQSVRVYLSGTGLLFQGV